MNEKPRPSRARSTLLPDASAGHLAFQAIESDPPPEEGISSTSQYLSGIQALARLPVLQRLRDEKAGHNTAGYVSGYRGSPLGGLDQALWKARKALAEHHVRFTPGLNEDLAATAVWGTQQVNMFEGARYDGVFSMWYAKGPGVDRSMDVLKHANAAGTSPLCGVLAVAGDDHGAKSSSIPHQSEHMFAAAMIPVLNPAGVQEYLDFGIHGWAMSRFSGCWVALKATADTVESSAAVIVDPDRVRSLLPEGLDMPPGGLSIRWPDAPLVQESRLQQFKTYAAMAYARANHLDRIVIDSPRARFGIATTGKSYLDVRQALDSLGIDAAQADAIGLRVYKVGMNWPLDAEGVRRFADGLEEILVVEEKRQLIEYQLKEQLYNWRDDVRPRVIGKYSDKGEWELPQGGWQLPAAGELTPAIIARVIAARIARFHESTRIAERLSFLDDKERALATPHASLSRVPHYCSGCPHNTSTMNLPEGSRALAGIGCHYMSLWLNPTVTQTFSQMGGEGVAWVGQAPFTDTKHVFANLGDGTYQHSGLLAIRQAVAADVPITYKILYNDAVAMTGGQPVEGALTVQMIAGQLAAEGVRRTVVVTDQPERYAGPNGLPAGTAVRHRRDLDQVQRELRDIAGVTALIYDQTCAAEKRRRRKKKEYPDPAIRAFINERVCEGCGDCSAKSNCMSVVPVDTEWGRKRLIDQSSCNKDFSCVEGFCPSFVTVKGGKPRKGKGSASTTGGFGDLPEPTLPSLDQPYGVLVTGVGGTGVVTIGALIGLAANLEGKGVSVLDMAGLAQKGGPVWSHIRVARRPEDLHATRIATGEANALIGCDIVVAAADESLAKFQPGLTRAVLNNDFSVTSDFVRTFGAQATSGDVERFRDPVFPQRSMEEQIAEACGGDSASLSATRLATALMGDSIATNPMMLGFAYQKGLLPFTAASLMKAVEMHGVAVEFNKQAFLWGRRAAHDIAAVERAAAPKAGSSAKSHRPSASLDEAIARRVEDLTAYQDAIYARRYSDLVARVRTAESGVSPSSDALTTAVAKGYHKLLAYKDEYEVARLYTDPAFMAGIEAAFEGDYEFTFNLAPPLLSRRHPITGHLRKASYGPWMMRAFRGLARLKGLRGTAFDPFGYTADRRMERSLIADYEKDLDEILGALTLHNLDAAVSLASLPADIRGFGHVKDRHVANVGRRRADLLRRFRTEREPRDEDGDALPKSDVIMAG